MVQSIQVGEKAYQDFTLTTTNPGGHSSQPVRDNAIYVMSDALAKRQQGKSCFNFKTVEPELFAELAVLTKKAHAAA